MRGEGELCPFLTITGNPHFDDFEINKKGVVFLQKQFLLILRRYVGYMLEKYT